MLARVHWFLCLIVIGLYQDFFRHSPHTTFCLVRSPLIIQTEGQNKGRGYCGCMCACVCISVCAFCVGGGCVKEEVLSGTEVFCRCCREGVNGKSCGYQSYSALWLAKVCRVWPHPNSVLVFGLQSLNEQSLKSLEQKWFRGIKGEMKDPKEGGERRWGRKVRKTCLLVKVGVDVVV